VQRAGIGIVYEDLRRIRKESDKPFVQVQTLEIFFAIERDTEINSTSRVIHRDTETSKTSHLDTRSIETEDCKFSYKAETWDTVVGDSGIVLEMKLR